MCPQMSMPDPLDNKTGERSTSAVHFWKIQPIYSVSQKKSPHPRGPDIFSFFSQTV